MCFIMIQCYTWCILWSWLSIRYLSVVKLSKVARRWWIRLTQRQKNARTMDWFVWVDLLDIETRCTTNWPHWTVSLFSGVSHTPCLFHYLLPVVEKSDVHSFHRVFTTSTPTDSNHWDKCLLFQDEVHIAIAAACDEDKTRQQHLKLEADVSSAAQHFFF